MVSVLPNLALNVQEVWKIGQIVATEYFHYKWEENNSCHRFLENYVWHVNGSWSCLKNSWKDYLFLP